MPPQYNAAVWLHMFRLFHIVFGSIKDFGSAIAVHQFSSQNSFGRLRPISSFLGKEGQYTASTSYTKYGRSGAFIHFYPLNDLCRYLEDAADVYGYIVYHNHGGEEVYPNPW